MDAIITHGITTPPGSLTDEANLLCNSVTFNPTRKKKEYNGLAGTLQALRYPDPQMTIEFSGFVTAVSGLADDEPGSEVTTLATFTTPATAVHGFDPADGTLVYEDPSRAHNNEGDLAECSFTVLHAPFVT